MPVDLGQMRDALMPGLMAIQGRYDMMPSMWQAVFDSAGREIGAIPPWSVDYMPPLAPVAALAIGAAAAVMRNPVVSRRFLPWPN
jgi:hypothetical protein